MSQDINGQPSAAPSFHISPDEYFALKQEAENLRQYQAQTQEFLGRIEPIAPHIRRYLEDPDIGKMYDDTVAAYDSIRARSKPQLPPEWDPEVNPWLKKLEQVSEIAEQFKNRSAEYERMETEKANARILEENTKIAQSLVEKYPTLAENGHTGIRMIAQEAQYNNISFAEAAARLEPFYKAQARQDIDAPSLRSGSGMQGVPGPSDSKGEISMKDRFMEIMEKAR